MCETTKIQRNQKRSCCFMNETSEKQVFLNVFALFSFELQKKINNFLEIIDNLYIHIYNCLCNMINSKIQKGKKKHEDYY